MGTWAEIEQNELNIYLFCRLLMRSEMQRCTAQELAKQTIDRKVGGSNETFLIFIYKDVLIPKFLGNKNFYDILIQTNQKRSDLLQTNTFSSDQIS